MTTLWRVVWVEKEGKIFYSIPMDNKENVGELCKAVENYGKQYGFTPTGDVWIEEGEIDWKRIVGKD